MANWTVGSAIPRPGNYEPKELPNLAGELARQMGTSYTPLNPGAETATSPAGVSIGLSELRKAAEGYQELVDRLRMTLMAITLPEPPSAQAIEGQRPVPLRSSLAGGISEVAGQIERSNSLLAAILDRIDL